MAMVMDPSGKLSVKAVMVNSGGNAAGRDEVVTAGTARGAGAATGSGRSSNHGGTCADGENQQEQKRQHEPMREHQGEAFA